MFKAKLLVLADVAFAVCVIVLVELDNRDSLLSVVRHLLLEVLRIQDLDCRLGWIIKTFSASEPKQCCQENFKECLFHVSKVKFNLISSTFSF